ncbi:MAG TPA: phosphatase PAP2 family protein [Thermoanaerobaculia bacterium]|nr:phosphatase PAP2 family protein [Thermoanaerobaculia bacterium]
MLAHLFLRGNAPVSLLGLLPNVMPALVLDLVILLFAGVAVRIGVNVLRGRALAYVRHVSRWTWWLESARLVLMGAFAMHIYTTLKIFLPFAGGENADERLWDIDYALLFGHSPTVLFLELFGNPNVLRAIDWSYENVFRTTMFTAMGAALSSPSQRLRVALVGAKSAMWITGAWLYYTFPSLGPAYRFSELWDPISAYMPRTRELLDALFSNFLIVIGRRPGAVNMMLGIGAFPSLHVALHTLVVLWGRRFSPGLGVMGLAAAIIIFVGSIVTGWHYLVDSLAGLVLGGVFYALFFAVYHLKHWLGLFRAVRRGRGERQLRWPIKMLERAFAVR